VRAFEKIAAAIETYEKFARHDMASTLKICFLRHCNGMLKGQKMKRASLGKPLELKGKFGTQS